MIDKHIYTVGHKTCRFYFCNKFGKGTSVLKTRAHIVHQGSTLAGTLSISLVVSKSAFCRSLTLLIQERSRKEVKWLPSILYVRWQQF